MAPAGSKANYKTYEAQARMIRAIVAAHPEVKWNYKEIVQCYGSDMTKDALLHRVRLWKAEAIIIREGLKQGLDMKDLEIDEKKLPKTQEGVDKKNIAKYFGQSTGDGIQFQFRTIKKDAEQLRRTVQGGGDASKCLPSLSGSSSAAMTPLRNTPSKPTPSRSTGPRSGSGAKRALPVPLKRSSSEDDDDLDSEDWSDRDETPSKRAKTTGAAPGQKNGTPSRRAAIQAAVTIADSTAQLQSSESPPEEIDTPTSSAPLPISLPVSRAAPPSIFGNVEPKPSPFHQSMAPEPDVFRNSAFSGNGMDPYFGGGGAQPMYDNRHFNPEDDLGDDYDGEI